DGLVGLGSGRDFQLHEAHTSAVVVLGHVPPRSSKSRPPFVPDSEDAQTRSARSLMTCDAGFAAWRARNLRVMVVTSLRRAGAEHVARKNMNGELPEDPQRRWLRERLEGIQTRSAKASSWRDSAGPLRSLV